MYLSDTEIGKEYRVKDMKLLGRGIQTKLLDLGLVSCSFKVIINGRGPVLIEVKDTRLAIGRKMAKKIEIEEIEGC